MLTGIVLIALGIIIGITLESRRKGGVVVTHNTEALLQQVKTFGEHIKALEEQKAALQAFNRNTSSN